MKENQTVKTHDEVPLTSEENPAVVLNEDAVYVGATEEGLDCHGYERDEFIGLTSEKTVIDSKIKAGVVLQKIIEGERVESTLRVKRKDGSSYIAEVVGTPIDYNGKTYAKVVTHEIREFGEEDAEKDVDESNFADISEVELENIVQNIRVDAPSGQMALNAIMLDLAVGHNELEQYKEGALSLHKAVDERLQEEEQQNPDSKECDVLREVKKAAFGLYLRIQRGDEELHGNRDGKYSGYFN